MIGFDVRVPLVRFGHESPLSPVTLQVVVYALLQIMSLVLFSRTSDGRAEIVAVGEGGGRHAEPEHPYPHV